MTKKREPAGRKRVVRRPKSGKEDEDDGRGIYREVLSILARHDPLGFGRRSGPLEAMEMTPGVVRTGMDPPAGNVRPPRSAVERLTPTHGSELDSAPNEAKRGLRGSAGEMRARPAERRQMHMELRRDYGRVYNDAIAILARQDPSIAEFGQVTEQEYEVGARALVPRLLTASSELGVRRALEEEFSRLFGRGVTDQRDAPESPTWKDMGSEIWEAVRRERVGRR